MEGGFVNGSLANKQMNPGNIRSWPGVPTENGYSKFPSLEAGWKALYKQIENNIYGMGKKDNYPLRAKDGLSLREFFGGQRDKLGNVIPGGYPGYAPALDHNSPDHYAKFVAEQVGLLSIDDKLKTFVTEP